MVILVSNPGKSKRGRTYARSLFLEGRELRCQVPLRIVLKDGVQFVKEKTALFRSTQKLVKELHSSLTKHRIGKHPVFFADLGRVSISLIVHAENSCARPRTAQIDYTRKRI